MNRAAVAVLARRLPALSGSWQLEDVAPLLDELGLRLEPASPTRIDLRRDGGGKGGRVAVDAGSGLVEEVALNVTDLADPDDDDDLARLAAECEELVDELEPVLGPAVRNGAGDAVWFLDGARLELRRLFVVGRLALVRDEEARPPPPASDGEEQPWTPVRAGLVRLLAGLDDGEVIELAAGDRLYVQVGRTREEVLLLVSGPPTPDLEIGQVDGPPAARLRALGFSPPDADHLSWWYGFGRAADPLHLELAAGLVVDALRLAAGATAPDQVVWSAIAAGTETQDRASRLGVPRNPHQEP